MNVISTSPAFTKDDGETTKTTDADGDLSLHLHLQGHGDQRLWRNGCVQS
ncbi:MAG: hypothetical protein V8T46_02790 [Sutterella seckii]